MAARESSSWMDQWWKMGGAAGLVFVVLFIIGGIALQGNAPMVDDSAADIRSYYADHGRRYLVGDLIIAIGFVFFFLTFSSVLRSFLAAFERPEHIWSNLMFAGAILLTGVGAATAGGQGALAYNRGEFADDNLLKTIIAMTYYTFTLAFPMLAAVMVLASSLVILRTRALWNWLGWFGLVVVAALLIGALAILGSDPMGPLGAVGLIGLLGLLIWLVAVSVGLLRRETAPVVSA